MIYKPFKELQLSRLGMGAMRLPIISGGNDKDIDYNKAQEIIDYAMAKGINYFDSAYVYHSGESEVFLGKALSKYNRDSYYITSKYHVGANPNYEEVFEQQLKRYGTDRIDFYLIHCLMDDNIDTYLTNGCIDFFLQKQKEGEITYLGFSSHSSVKTLARFADHHQWDFAQIQLNYYDYYEGSAKKEYEVLKERNIPIMVMESVRGGRLASLNKEAEAVLKKAHPSWSIASWAFKWLKGLSQVQLCLSGMTTIDQIIDNVETFQAEEGLSAEDEKTLLKALDLFKSSIKVPCTGCRYCTEGCPKEINIPEILKVFNEYKLDGSWALRNIKSVQTKGFPKDCINCKACTKHCPQSIRIPSIMKELTEALENK
ncbi:MAG: aldo/keto reductase [Sphaerochaetaceae bacterium]|nr:aldo/keto reductase [Sphaerochaetaceae bacterium]